MATQILAQSIAQEYICGSLKFVFIIISQIPLYFRRRNVVPV